MTVPMREIGIPVKSVSKVALFVGARADGSPTLYATMAQAGAPFFIVDIDIRTGHCMKYLADLPNARYPISAHWSDCWKVLYAGSCYTGHLHRFDPTHGRLEDLGAINPAAHELACFPCSMDEHPDGTLYLGSYNGCDLTRFDPATGIFTNFGRMDDTEMYFYVQCGEDGTVAGRVANTHPYVMAFDPTTGARRAVGSAADAPAGAPPNRLIKGIDGLLYLTSHAGAFRISGLETIPVTAAPAPKPVEALPEGTTYRWLDADVFAYRRLELTEPSGEVRVLDLDWEGDGSDLFCCHAGPDGKLYGTSMMPEHLYSYDPRSEDLIDHGTCCTTDGEAYSFGNLHGKLYIASYPSTKLSVYDPAKPYCFGTDAEANPRQVGSPDHVANRPRSLVAGPAGKVWLASQPNSGQWGGSLAWYDPNTGQFGSHIDILPDCRCESMTYLADEGLLLVGFSIEGGTGTHPRTEQAGLVLWEPARDAEVWRGDFGLNIYAVTDLCAVGDGMAYALIIRNDAEKHLGLYLLDLRTKTISDHRVLTSPPHGESLWSSQSLFRHHGFIYGATQRGVFRAPLGTSEVAMYYTLPDDEELKGHGAVIGDTWYFVSTHRLCALALPTA